MLFFLINFSRSHEDKRKMANTDVKNLMTPQASIIINKVIVFSHE
ncbi:hypothetical protein HMPREF2534_03442 [Bacteroides thetaiotaomicron]|nr:hypothetical protein HMPREF2534_03442 [Bacteroides thetaiotaomicron]